MSDTQCKAGDTTGFPVALAQSLHTNWPATSNSQQQLQRLTVPTDFSLQWQNNGVQNCTISVRQTLAANGIPGVFQISGFSPEGSTITYGSAQYKCSGVISIVQNQHPTFSQDSSAQYEMILAFQIVNKSTNPSSPPNSFNATLSAYLTSDFPKGLIMGFTKSIPVVAIPLTMLWAKRKMPPPANVVAIAPPVFKPLVNEKYPEINAIYKHYKGGLYKFITMANHTETDEKMVSQKIIR